jgi:hypothetical protein
LIFSSSRPDYDLEGKKIMWDTTTLVLVFVVGILFERRCNISVSIERALFNLYKKFKEKGRHK